MAYAINQKVLNGRGSVVSYTKAPDKFYYRELIKGTTKYRTKLIAGADTVEAAVELALDARDKLQSEEVFPVAVSRERKAEKVITNRRGKVRDVVACIYDFLENEQRKVDAGMLTEKARFNKSEALLKQLVPYLAFKGIAKTNQFSVTTFDEYPLWRKKKNGEPAALSTRALELGYIQQFLTKYLWKHKLIDRDLDVKDMTPKIAIPDDEIDANPPLINPGNWRKVQDALKRNREASEGYCNHRGFYFAQMLYRWVMVARNSGLRPDCEMNQLRWMDVKRENVGRWSKSQGKTVDKFITNIFVIKGKMKRGRKSSKRTVPCNGVDAQLKQWKKEQQDYIDKYCPGVVITDESYIFGNPYNEMKPYSYGRFTKAWENIRDDCELTPYALSPDRNYTIYSLRSTFICNCILQDKDIYVTAKLAGNTVAVCEKYYAQLDMIRMSKKVTDFEYGKKGRRTSESTNYV